MYKPPVFNRYLNKKWNEKDNDIMIQKLSNAKSNLDKDCPESYLFFKTKLKKIKSQPKQTCKKIVFLFYNVLPRPRNRSKTKQRNFR